MIELYHIIDKRYIENLMWREISWEWGASSRLGIT